jgi:hypothetical protein
LLQKSDRVKLNLEKLRQTRYYSDKQCWDRIHAMNVVDALMTRRIPILTLCRVPCLIVLLWEVWQPAVMTVLFPDSVLTGRVMVGLALSDVVLKMIFPWASAACLTSEVVTDILSDSEVTSRLEPSGWQLVQPYTAVGTFIVGFFAALYLPTIRGWLFFLTWSPTCPLMSSCFIDDFCDKASQALISAMHEKIISDSALKRITTHPDEPITRPSLHQASKNPSTSPSELLPEMLLLKDRLERLWNSAFPGVMVALTNAAIPAILCGYTSFSMTRTQPEWAALWGMFGLLSANRVIGAVGQLAKITDNCMSTSPSGLHGALLLKNVEISTLTSHDAFALVQMQHILSVCKMGARLKVIVDWALLSAVVASTAASFGKMFLGIVQQIIENNNV